MNTEKQLQNYLKNIARAARVGFYKMTCDGQSGFPDVLLCFAGWAVLVELKSPAKTGRLRPRQKIMLEKLTNQGQECYVIDSKEQADSIIAGLIKRPSREGGRPLIY